MEIYERKSISMFVMILEKSPNFEDRGGEFLHLYPQKIGLYRVVFGVWLENCSYSCTLEKYYNTIEELTEEEWKILDSVGYGNLFPLELPSTLIRKYMLMGIQV